MVSKYDRSSSSPLIRVLVAYFGMECFGRCV